MLNGMGTLQYMAPELFEDGRSTKASDVYAVGMTAWHVRVSYVIDDSGRSRVVRSTAD
jgi:serine/threonine protein kinase